MGQWEPIETAPVNQSVLVYIPNAEHYGEGIYRALQVESDWITNPDGSHPRHWQTTGWHIGRDCKESAMPTHWMPLPEPPKTKEDVLCFQCKVRVGTIPVYRAMACAPCYEAWLAKQAADPPEVSK